MHLDDWLLWATLLTATGICLRRLLSTIERGTTAFSVSRDEQREELFQSTAEAVEMQLRMLSVSLDATIDLCLLKHRQLTIEQLQLTVSQWNRMSGILCAVLREIAKYAPAAPIRTSVPVTIADFLYFKSQTMIDYAKLHKGLSRFVFRSKPRFKLHLRMLGEAVEALTADFRLESCTYANLHSSVDLWHRLDHDLHDFDVVTKEVLLAIRQLYLSLPEPEINHFSAGVQSLCTLGLRPVAA